MLNLVRNDTTLNLPSLNSRADVRRELEQHVEEFLARGGKIREVGRENSLDQVRPFRISPLTTGVADVRPSKPKPRRAEPAFDEKKGRCCICGCTWTSACSGGCWWAAPNLCSSCVPPKMNANGSKPRRIEWTPQRDLIMQKKFPTSMSIYDLADLLGISDGAIYQRAKVLGLKRLGRSQ